MTLFLASVINLFGSLFIFPLLICIGWQFSLVFRFGLIGLPLLWMLITEPLIWYIGVEIDSVYSLFIAAVFCYLFTMLSYFCLQQHTAIFDKPNFLMKNPRALTKYARISNIVLLVISIVAFKFFGILVFILIFLLSNIVSYYLSIHRIMRDYGVSKTDAKNEIMQNLIYNAGKINT